MKNTIQRQIVLNVVQATHNHPTVEEIYQEVQKKHPTISKSTIYRNLHQLAEDGEIRSVFVPDSPERFDNRLHRHYHFHCKKCSSVTDVDIDYLSEINEMVQNTYSFQVDEHDVIFTGICPECKIVL